MLQHRNSIISEGPRRLLIVFRVGDGGLRFIRTLQRRQCVEHLAQRAAEAQNRHDSAAKDHQPGPDGDHPAHGSHPALGQLLINHNIQPDKLFRSVGLHTGKRITQCFFLGKGDSVGGIRQGIPVFKKLTVGLLKDKIPQLSGVFDAPIDDISGPIDGFGHQLL